MSSEASTLLGLLADDDRLRTVAALVLGSGPAPAAEVANAARLDLRRAVKALTRLAGAGLVDQDGDSYALRPERFREALEALGRPEGPAVPNSGLGADADRILRIFVRDGKLVQIPAVQSKRRVVLDWLARLFEPGQAYPEKEVNERLAAVHADYAAAPVPGRRRVSPPARWVLLARWRDVRGGQSLGGQGIGASAEDERVALHVDLHGAAFAEYPFEQGHRQAVAELLLDRALERPGAEVGVVAPLRQPQLRFR